MTSALPLPCRAPQPCECEYHRYVWRGRVWVLRRTPKEAP